MLPSSVLLQRMQLVARRHPKLAKLSGSIDHSQLPASDFENVRRESLWALAAEYALGHLILKAPDHRCPLTHNVSLSDTFRNRARKRAPASLGRPRVDFT